MRKKVFVIDGGIEGFCHRGSGGTRLAGPERQGKFVLSSVPEARCGCTSDNLKAAIVFLCYVQKIRMILK